jgi:hypothetical protein
LRRRDEGSGKSGCHEGTDVHFHVEAQIPRAKSSSCKFNL